MPHTLSDVQLEKIRNLADDTRRSLGFVGQTPIANDIFTILDNLGIFLLEYPIRSTGNRPAFSAALICISDGCGETTFLGLNTADYLDKQVFAVAHELYHFRTKTGSHVSRLSDDYASTPVEAEANRFAADFLLPEQTLRGAIVEEFGCRHLYNTRAKTLLRFIARLHCIWWLPYRSIVRRLRELGTITDEQYTTLYAMDERNEESEYGRLGRAVNEEVFVRLNSPTKHMGTSAKNLEIIIRNFEDQLIDEDKFVTELALFNRIPEDFGYNITVSEDVHNAAKESHHSGVM